MQFLKKLHPANYVALAAVLACIPLMGLISSCSDATNAAISAYGQKHHIKLYSGGVLIGEWESTGKINNEAHSDGYYFKDDKTGKLVTICGQIIITVE